MDDTPGRVRQDPDVVTGRLAETTAGDAVGDGGDVNERTREIRDEIEETRVEMAETIDAIQEKLKPRNIVASATDRVKSAATERVREMADTASQTAQQAMDYTRDRVQQNPVPLALLGIGAAWLIARQASSNDSYRRRREQGDYREYGGEWTRDEALYRDQDDNGLVARIRDNPIPATLAGVGLTWLAFSNAGPREWDILAMARPVPRGTRPQRIGKPDRFTHTRVRRGRHRFHATEREATSEPAAAHGAGQSVASRCRCTDARGCVRNGGARNGDRKRVDGRDPRQCCGTRSRHGARRCQPGSGCCEHRRRCGREGRRKIVAVVCGAISASAGTLRPRTPLISCIRDEGALAKAVAVPILVYCRPITPLITASQITRLCGRRPMRDVVAAHASPPVNAASRSGVRSAMRVQVVIVAACIAATTAPQAQAPAPATPESLVLAAKRAAGQDYAGTFLRICVAPDNLATVPAPRSGECRARRTRGARPRDAGTRSRTKCSTTSTFIGTRIHSAWALTTSDGIIVIDTLFDYAIEPEIVEGLSGLGLNPRDIKYVVISHAHGDHDQGAALLQNRYDAKVVMGVADWDATLQRPSTAPVGVPKRDIAVGPEGRKITLGDTTLDVIATPGHTPGTLSSSFR